MTTFLQLYPQQYFELMIYISWYLRNNSSHQLLAMIRLIIVRMSIDLDFKIFDFGKMMLDYAERHSYN